MNAPGLASIRQLKETVSLASPVLAHAGLTTSLAKPRLLPCRSRATPRAGPVQVPCRWGVRVVPVL
jgi:hypothetical protein